MRYFFFWVTLVLIAGFFSPPVSAEKDLPAQSEPAKTVSQEGPQEEKLADTLAVTEIKICLGIEDKNPVSSQEIFSNEVEKIYCWSLISGAKKPTEIEHIWYYQDEIMAKVTLPIKSPHYRTWSSKKILKEWTGPWKVVIVDEAGNVLASTPFKIEAQIKPEEPSAEKKKVKKPAVEPAEEKKAK